MFRAPLLSMTRASQRGPSGTLCDLNRSDFPWSNAGKNVGQVQLLRLVYAEQRPIFDSRVRTYFVGVSEGLGITPNISKFCARRDEACCIVKLPSAHRIRWRVSLREQGTKLEPLSIFRENLPSRDGDNATISFPCSGRHYKSSR